MPPLEVREGSTLDASLGTEGTAVKSRTVTSTETESATRMESTADALASGAAAIDSADVNNGAKPDPHSAGKSECEAGATAKASPAEGSPNARAALESKTRAQDSTVDSTDASTEAGASTEASTEVHTEIHAQLSAEATAEVSTEASTYSTATFSTEASTDASAEVRTETSAEGIAEAKKQSGFRRRHRNRGSQSPFWWQKQRQHHKDLLDEIRRQQQQQLQQEQQHQQQQQQQLQEGLEDTRHQQLLHKQWQQGEALEDERQEQQQHEQWQQGEGREGERGVQQPGAWELRQLAGPKHNQEPHLEKHHCAEWQWSPRRLARPGSSGSFLGPRSLVGPPGSSLMWAQKSRSSEHTHTSGYPSVQNSHYLMGPPNNSLMWAQKSRSSEYTYSSGYPSFQERHQGSWVPPPPSEDEAPLYLSLASLETSEACHKLDSTGHKSEVVTGHSHRGASHNLPEAHSHGATVHSHKSHLDFGVSGSGTPEEALSGVSPCSTVSDGTLDWETELALLRQVLGMPGPGCTAGAPHGGGGRGEVADAAHELEDAASSSDSEFEALRASCVSRRAVFGAGCFVPRDRPRKRASHPPHKGCSGPGSRVPGRGPGMIARAKPLNPQYAYWEDTPTQGGLALALGGRFLGKVEGG